MANVARVTNVAAFTIVIGLDLKIGTDNSFLAVCKAKKSRNGYRLS